MTQIERTMEMLAIVTNTRLEVIYESIFRLWVKGGRDHSGLAKMLELMEAEMDTRNMDTDGILDRVAA